MSTPSLQLGKSDWKGGQSGTEEEGGIPPLGHRGSLLVPLRCSGKYVLIKPTSHFFKKKKEERKLGDVLFDALHISRRRCRERRALQLSQEGSPWVTSQASLALALAILPEC